MLITYLTGGDHDTNLLDGLGELIGLDSAVVVKIEVLESLKQDGFLVGGASGLLGELLLQLTLKTTNKIRNVLHLDGWKTMDELGALTGA